MKTLNLEKLDYQQKAIDSILHVFQNVHFDDPKYKNGNPVLSLEKNKNVIATNIAYIQKENEIKENHDLSEKYLNLDVLMETGTGKTLTFIETIYRLHKKYKLSKFIILVPSKAIKYGTVNTIKTSQKHFSKQYKANIEVSDDITQVENLMNGSNKKISVYVTTHQGFNRESNTINKRYIETPLLGRKHKYIDAIAELRPVIIIDEPHRAEGERTLASIPNFKPQMILKFGATYRTEHKNLIYALDSMEAFTKNLVKGINIAKLGAEMQGKHSLTYMGKVNEKTAKIRYIRAEGDKPIDIEVMKKESIGDKFGYGELNDLVVDKINENDITFINKRILLKGQEEPYSALLKAQQNIMLKKTIEKHFEKEEMLFKRGIKALSLIFIHGVDSYLDGGYLSELFERLYEIELKKVLEKPLHPEYRQYLERSKNNIKSVHHGYFARTQKDDDEKEAVELILNKKTELLSKDTDLRFIFSMWALQEGWDNPNIFTLCKLAPSNSHITKLQQIGRGLRLAVRETNRGFERITMNNATDENEFDEINRLSVIVPESEKDFVDAIQNEIRDKSKAMSGAKITPQMMINQHAVENRRTANKILDRMDELKIIKLDDDVTNGIITGSTEDIIEALDKLEKEGLKFNKSIMKEMLSQKNPLEGKIRLDEKENDFGIEINTEKWDDFKQLWNEINAKATYEFIVDDKSLIASCIANINKELNVSKPTFRSTEYSSVHELDTKDVETSAEETINIGFYRTKEFIVELIKETRLATKTIAAILKGINNDKYEQIKHDEIEALRQIKEIVKLTIYNEIITNLYYDTNVTEIRETAYSLVDKDNKEQHVKKILRSKIGRKAKELENEQLKKRSLLIKHQAYDSESENNLIEESNDKSILVFTKLPRIKIPLPNGETYSPDFGYIVEGKNGEAKSIHLIVENKGVSNEDSLRNKERRKIEMARKFFDSLKQKNPDIHYEVRYEDRKMRKGDLADIIKGLRGEELINEE